MQIDDAYKGALILGTPSIIGTWGLDLLRDAAAAMEPPLEVRLLEKLDEIGPEEAWPRSLYLTQFPSASVLSIIESERMPVVAFLDEACDATAYIRRSSGCSFVEALRSATSGAVANRALLHAKTALVVRRSRSGPPNELIDKLFNHLMMRLPAEASNAIKQKYCGSVLGASTLEGCLQGVSSYKPLGEWSNELSSEEAAIVEQVLAPLLLMAFQEECVPVKWPCGVFLSADRPNEPAPIVANVTGAARNIYYGPFFHLPPGTYRARLVAGFSKSAIRSHFSAEVCGSTSLAKARFQPRDQGVFQGDFLVIHKVPQDAVEVRFRNDEGAIEGQVGLAWVEFQLLGKSDWSTHNVT
jgi:hypothetical protein